MEEDKGVILVKSTPHYRKWIVREAINLPLVDSHMHIQSNDIAPIPIMKGVIHFAGEQSKSKGELKIEKAENGKKYYENRMARHELSFRTLDNPEENDNFPSNDNISPLNRSSAAFRTWFLELVSGSTRRSMANTAARWPATIKVNNYGKVARHTSFNIAGIYMNDLLKNTMGYASRREINREAEESSSNYNESGKNVNRSENERNRLIKARRSMLSGFRRLVSGYYNSEQANINGIFEFSILLGMELMYAHYWGAYGIPIYIYHGGTLYFVWNDLRYILTRGRSTTAGICHNAYDIKRESLERNFMIGDVSPNDYKHHEITSFYGGDRAVIGNGEGYKHFLVPVDNEEVVQFEDLEQHVEHTKMAVIRYPFKLLPFYHFDPRRFFSPDIDETLHEFYLTEKGSNRNRLTRVNMINDVLKRQQPFVYKMEIDDLKDELLQGSSSGLFWGIKMYAALGCPPYVYKKEEREKIFPKLDLTGQYDGLLGFYRYCADNDIPVTCHGSPQGMTIADPGVYLKEYLKQQHKSSYSKSQNVNFPEGWEQYIQGIGLIDDFSSPKSWKIVLDELGSKKSKFRLCLAHYGGRDFMTGEYEDDPVTSPYCWHKDINELLINREYNQVYADLSCYVIESVHELFFAFPTMLSGDMLTDEEQRHILALRLKAIKDDRQEKGRNSPYFALCTMAEKLVNDLKSNGRLRYRLMFGTDWPMSEITVKGVPDYASTMFVVLQLVTEQMGWDAWHQFTVINPLRFLGLIEEVDNEDREEPLAFNFQKLKLFEEHLKSCLEDIYEEDETKFKEKYGMKKNDTEIEIEKNYNDLMQKYVLSGVPTASSKMMRKDNLENGRLRILGEDK